MSVNVPPMSMPSEWRMAIRACGDSITPAAGSIPCRGFGLHSRRCPASGQGGVMDNLSVGQQALLQKLKESIPAAAIRWDEARGVARSVRGALAQPGAAHEKPAATVKRFLAAFAPLFGPADLAGRLRLVRTRTD